MNLKYLWLAHKNVHLFLTDSTFIPNPERSDIAYGYTYITGTEFKPMLAGRILEIETSAVSIVSSGNVNCRLTFNFRLHTQRKE